MTIKNTDFCEPFQKFNEWFCEAIADKRIHEPTAMSIASVNENFQPSNRMVLLKKHDENGFCFFTNLKSRKAQEIFINSSVSLCFYWGVLGRQIRIEGLAKLVENFEADEYFATRPRDSQIGAWASLQSSTMEDHQDFEKRIKFFNEKFKDQTVLRPEFWSGFRVEPNYFEFWHEGKYRLHHRQIYKKIINGWEEKILYP